jgi:DNA-binding LytR/AlgR family response regulator
LLSTEIKNGNLKYSVKPATGIKGFFAKMERNKDIVKRAWQIFAWITLNDGETITEAKEYFADKFKDKIGKYVINTNKVEYVVSEGDSVRTHQKTEYYFLFLDDTNEEIKTIKIKDDDPKGGADDKK